MFNPCTNKAMSHSRCHTAIACHISNILTIQLTFVSCLTPAPIKPWDNSYIHKQNNKKDSLERIPPPHHIHYFISHLHAQLQRDMLHRWRKFSSECSQIEPLHPWAITFIRLFINSNVSSQLNKRNNGGKIAIIVIIGRYNKCVTQTVCWHYQGELMWAIVIVALYILSSSRTRVRVKLGLFNSKIRNENRRYIHRLIYQLNEQDLLCHSI